MNNQENNKMIAEFMGLAPNECGVYQTKRGPYHLENLSYHISWDWLMPVVKKIDDLFGNTDEVDDMINVVHNAVLQFNIRTTHQAVIEFINEYNKNK